MNSRVNHFHVRFVAVALLLLLNHVAPSETTLLKNATVHTVSGAVLSPGDVLIQDGKIVSIGQIGSSADHMIDLKGQHLYPGLIALGT